MWPETYQDRLRQDRQKKEDELLLLTGRSKHYAEILVLVAQLLEIDELLGVDHDSKTLRARVKALYDKQYGEDRHGPNRRKP